MKATHYKRIESIVRRVIHEWDPYSLLAGGAPEDEFDGEIRSVVRQVDRIGSPADAAHLISQVFSSAFEAERFAPADCRESGERLYRALRDAQSIEDKGSG